MLTRYHLLSLIVTERFTDSLRIATKYLEPCVYSSNCNQRKKRSTYEIVRYEIWL